MIEENVKNLLACLKGGNCFSEPVTLVAATKTRTAEEINRAIRAGISDVGENRVQEFTAKYNDVQGANRHFIGRLQTNKVKYLIGKTHLIHSVDSEALVLEIATRSLRAGIVTNVLLEVNLGEENKGGVLLQNALKMYEKWRNVSGICVKGFMAMLPLNADEKTNITLCDEMRSLFHEAKKQDGNIAYLSMGMSGDWQLCLSRGANMIRLGTAIFGERKNSY